MKNRSNTIQLLCLCLLLINHTTNKPCGVVQLFEGEKVLNRNVFSLSSENLGEPFNGSKISVMGWVQLSNTLDIIHPFLQIEVLPNSNESTANFPESLDQLVSIYYDNTNRADSRLVIEVPFDDANVRIQRLEMNLIANEWYFLAYTADYRAGTVIVHFTNHGNLNSLTTLQVDFPQLEIRQNINIDVGCTPDDRNLPNAVNSCLVGKVRDFGFVLDFFSDPTLLYTLIEKNDTYNATFFFDSFDRVSSELVSIDSSNTPYDVVSANTLNSNSLLFFEKTIASVPKAFVIDTNDLSHSPTIFVRFKYQEPLPDDFLFASVEDSSNTVIMQIRLIRSGTRRRVEIKLKNNVVALDTSQIFTDGIVEEFSVSLIQRNNQTAVYFFSNAQKLISSFIDQTVSGDLDITFFSQNQAFNGSIELIQVNTIESAAGSVYKGFSSQSLFDDQSCKANCDLFTDIRVNQNKCSSCETNFVLEGNSQTCASDCVDGFYNTKGACYTCRGTICENALGNYFELKNLGSNQLEMSQIRDLDNFDNKYDENFVLSYPNLQRGVNYDYTVTPDAETRKAMFNVTPIAPFDVGTQNAIINVRNNSTLRSETGELLREATSIIAASPADSDESEDDNDEDDDDNPRVEKTNESVEKSFKILGIFSYAFMVIAMAIGLFGLLKKCPYVPHPKFLYQKFLQTFIMFQYMAFWSFYNANFPYNLKEYLNAMFQYSTGWHDIFNSSARNDHSDPKYTEDFLKNTHERFFEEEVHTHFVLSYGFVLMLTFIVLVIYGVLKGLAAASSATNQNSLRNRASQSNTYYSRENTELNNQNPSFLQSMVEHFEWKLIFTIFLMFIVEVTAFIFYNFYGPAFSFSLFTFSFVLAILWGLLILALVGFVLTYPFNTNDELINENNQQRFGFIYEGLRLDSIRANFQGIQYMHYLLFAFVLVVAYNSRLTQIIITALFLIGFIGYVIALQPAHESFDRIEQTIVHLLLLLCFVFVFILVGDDSARTMNSNERWVIGYFVAILSFIIVLWNLIIIAYKVFTYLSQCSEIMTIHQNTKGPVRFEADEDQRFVSGAEDRREVQRQGIPVNMREPNRPTDTRQFITNAEDRYDPSFGNGLQVIPEGRDEFTFTNDRPMMQDSGAHMPDRLRSDQETSLQHPNIVGLKTNYDLVNGNNPLPGREPYQRADIESTGHIQDEYDRFRQGLRRNN